MARRGSFASNQTARAVSSHIPIITADVEAATLYAQSWQHHGDGPIRGFDILALDEQMAEEMGGIRLKEKHGENIVNWRLIQNRPYAEPSRGLILAVLTYEDPDETQLREETFKARQRRAS